MGSEITRKLATIQRIEEIRPIEGADAIEVARVLGWDVVVKKGEFKVGDLAVYFEIDSFLPRREEWAFLEKSCLRRMGEKEGLRLKTIKLRGQVSQGLLLPVTILSSLDIITNPIPELMFEHPEEGMDVTELLGIVKWDPPLPASLGGSARGNFPSFIHKTDQERIQNCFKTLKNKWIDHEWEVTVKMDGSSFTAYYYAPEDRFGICSRNLDLIESEENTFWRVARKLDLENKMRSLPTGESYAIQAELCGPGIQKNFEQLDEHDIFVFDVFNINEQKYLVSEHRRAIAQYLGLKHVPVVFYSARLHPDVSLEWLLEKAEGPSYIRKNREGIVFKSLNDPNISFKIISNSYLLKHEE